MKRRKGSKKKKRKIKHSKGGDSGVREQTGRIWKWRNWKKLSLKKKRKRKKRRSARDLVRTFKVRERERKKAKDEPFSSDLESWCDWGWGGNDACHVLLKAADLSLHLHWALLHLWGTWRWIVSTWWFYCRYFPTRVLWYQVFMIKSLSIIYAQSRKSVSTVLLSFSKDNYWYRP